MEALRIKKSTAEGIRDLKLRIMELQQEHIVQLYLETMPEYNPTYKYCFATSNASMHGEHQNIDFWLLAVIKHMGMRTSGHGGAYTESLIVQIPEVRTQGEIDVYIDYISNKLRKKLRISKPRTTKQRTKRGPGERGARV